MSPEPSDDIELRGIAMGAMHEHEAAVTSSETDSALASVRARLAAGDDGAPLSAPAGSVRRRSPWLLLGAAAAVVAMVAAGLVAVLDGDDGDVIVPATGPAVVEPSPETTTAPTVTAEPTTTSASAPTDAVRQTMANALALLGMRAPTEM